MQQTKLREIKREKITEGTEGFLKLIADTNRLRILLTVGRKEHCVCEITAALGLPQNLISHHLGRLKAAGLVVERKEGQFVYYRKNGAAIRMQVRHLNKMLLI